MKIDGGSYLLFGFFPINNFGYSISFLRLPIDVHTLITGSYKREATFAGGLGTLLLMPADVGGTLIFFSDLRLLPIGAIAMAPLKIVVSIIYAIGYGLVAFNATVILFSRTHSSPQKRQALLDLIASVMQVVVAILIIVGYCNPVLCPILATVACLMGFVSFLHRMKFPECAPDGSVNNVTATPAIAC